MTDRPMDSHQLAQAARAAAQREAQLAEQLREAADERARAEEEATRVAAAEAARGAHLARCLADFDKAGQALMLKKLATPADHVALVRAIVDARNAFRDAAVAFEGSTETDRRLSEHFVQVNTNAHATTAVLVWLQPLLNVKNA